MASWSKMNSLEIIHAGSKAGIGRAHQLPVLQSANLQCFGLSVIASQKCLKTVRSNGTKCATQCRSNFKRAQVEARVEGNCK